MSGYTPLFTSIMTSSIWTEDDATRITWITLLFLADKDGKVEGSIPGLAQVAHVPVDACEAAIEKFKAPDRYSRTKEYEGRRIIEIENGWLVLNHGKFRERAKSRAKYYQEWRDRKKEKTPQTPKEKKQTTDSDTDSATPAQQRNSCATVAQQVEEFWNIYPKQVGKADLREWLSSNPVSEEEFVRMLDKIEKLKATDEWQRENGRYIPLPLKWLEREGWHDELPDKSSTPGHCPLPIIPGKNCGKCGVPAVYKASGDYDNWYCWEHMPERVKEHYA